MIRSRVLGGVGLLALGMVACGASSDEGDGSNEAAVTELKAYWADAKKLDLGDLSRVTAGFATDELNLSVSGVSTKFDAPAVFAASADPNLILPDNMEIKALDTIVSGLAAQFGEKELGTEVNKVRLSHLQGTSDKYYLESGFTLGADVPYNWSFQAGGFLNGAGATVGFDAGATLSSRVIIASPSERIGALLKAPLAAVKDMRGFVYPRSVADVRKMKPGEMFALRGLGKLGANFGVGAPILVAEPTAGAVYRIVVSAGVSGIIGGQVDVQLVKLEGDEVIVDVGVENGQGVSFNAAIKDGWGIKGICEDGIRCLRPVELGPVKVDLARMVEKAVEKRLNQSLAVKVEGQVGTASSRVSLSRFRFHLDQGNPDEVSRALEHALKLDVRLAQALYNRDLDQASPPVVAELDAVRAATTSTRSFGFELLGMDVYHRAVVQKQGTFVVQTPDGARAILFDSLNKHGGWFQMDHGFTRTGVAAQTLDAKNPDAFRSEANLFMQVNVGDTHMDDDMMIDNIDALLLGTVGAKAIDALDRFGNDMQRMVWDRCPVVQTQNGKTQTRTWDEKCNVALLDDPDMKSLHQQGLDAFEPFASSLPQDLADLARKTAGARLVLQSVGIHNLDALNGPNASFALDLRLDDRALAALTARSKDEYRAALREYTTAVWADRIRVGKDQTKDDVRRAVDDKYGSNMDKMAKRFEAGAKKYKLISDAERLIAPALGGKKFVQYPLGLRFSVDGDASKTYESAVLLSTSHDRAIAAAHLFDDLFDAGFSPSLYAEHTVVFPLLALVPSDKVELGMDIRADVKSSFWVSRDRFLKAGFQSATAHAKGASVSTISAGMFDLDKVISSSTAN